MIRIPSPRTVLLATNSPRADEEMAVRAETKVIFNSEKLRLNIFRLIN